MGRRSQLSHQPDRDPRVPGDRTRHPKERRSPTGRGTLRSPQIETLNGEFGTGARPATDPLDNSRPSWIWRFSKILVVIRRFATLYMTRAGRGLGGRVQGRAVPRVHGGLRTAPAAGSRRPPTAWRGGEMLPPRPMATPGNTGTGYTTWRTRSDTSIEWDRAGHSTDRFRSCSSASPKTNSGSSQPWDEPWPRCRIDNEPQSYWSMDSVGPCGRWGM